jgi:hypothetical protein
VVRRERHVGLEEDAKAALERVVDRADTRTPEQAVVDEQQLRVAFGGELEQLRLGRDAGRDALDLGCAGNLQAVGGEVLEAGRFEQRVGLGEDVCERRGDGATITRFRFRALLPSNEG